MRSNASLRVLSLARLGRQPLPVFSKDDYINFCVAEALVAREQMESEEGRKAAERERWKAEIKNQPPPAGG